MSTDILIVDDEHDIRELTADILADEGYTTRTAATSDAVLEALDDRTPTAIILDIWLQGSELDGLGILEIIQRKYPELPVIMISGHGNIETAVQSIRLGAYDYLEKPFKADKLLLVLKRAIEASRLKKENQDLRHRGTPETELIGQSQALQHIRHTVDKVAPTASRVFISGNAGVGKEVVARLIHQRSKRASAPFIAMNAASIAPEQMERELLGVQGEMGAASDDHRVGILERAHGGTLFLDEISDMPLPVQARFLRILQENSFERVGGHKPIKVDLRVIAATTKDLTKEISAGRFREDLYYRLNVVPIHIPPLAERREDIAPLIHYFMQRSANLLGMPPKTIADDALAVMEIYPWPGNVRQLRNLVEWLLIMAPAESNKPIDASLLPPEMFSNNPASLRPDVNADIMSMPLRAARELFEKQYLLAQLDRFSGNISRTAQFVGMERSALHRKLKGLSGEDGGENAA